MAEIIFTLDARDNVFLEVMQDWFNLDEESIFDNINSAFKECVSLLDKKKVQYAELKNGLVPKADKNEIAFVFDRLNIESSWYGGDIFEHIVPLLEKQNVNSVLFGDFVGNDNLKEKLQTTFFNHLKVARQFTYQNHRQFCIVYINNLSDQAVINFNNGLCKYEPYVGYFDLTYASFLKTYLSTILSRHFLKAKSTIISSHEFNEDLNVYGYPFEKYGFNCMTINTHLYDMFLSYKIEREVFPKFENDTTFSINAITKNVFNISDFEIKIEEPKLQYLLTNKADNMERAGFTKFTLQEIEAIIKSKIQNNYIYNLCFLESSQTLKFNILIETIRADKDKPMKLLSALEYKPQEKILRLITMF